LAPWEEVQLSLEQAFYLVADLKRLEVYLPSPPPPFQQQEEEEKEVELEEEGQEGHVTDLADGKADEQQQQQQQQQRKIEEMAAESEPLDGAKPRVLSVMECWKAYVIFFNVRQDPKLLSSTAFLSLFCFLLLFEVSY